MKKFFSFIITHFSRRSLGIGLSLLGALLLILVMTSGLFRQDKIYGSVIYDYTDAPRPLNLQKQVRFLSIHSDPSLSPPVRQVRIIGSKTENGQRTDLAEGKQAVVTDTLWKIDLGKKYFVDHIIILNRTRKGQDLNIGRTGAYSVLASLNNFPDDPIADVLWKNRPGIAMAVLFIALVLIFLGTYFAFGEIASLAITSLIVTAYFSLGLWGCYNPDSTSYYYYAQSMTGGFTQSLAYPAIPRSVGYPFLLLLSGVTWGNTAWGMILLQSFMAFLVPLIVYSAVTVVQRAAAFLSAALVIFSFIPYVFAKTLMLETSLLFFFFLSLCFLLHYYHSAKVKYFWFAVLALAGLTFLQSVYTYVFIPFLVFAAIKHTKPKAHYAAGIAVLILAFALTSLTTHSRFYVAHDRNASITWRALFSNVYLAMGTFVKGDAPFVMDGPATQKMVAAVRASFAGLSITEITDKYYFAGDKKTLLEPYADNTDGLVQAMFTKPSRGYYYMLWKIFQDDPNGESLFLSVALEQLKHHPMAVVEMLIKNFKAYFWGLPASFSAESDVRYGEAIFFYGDKPIYLPNPYLGYPPYAMLDGFISPSVGVHLHVIFDALFAFWAQYFFALVRPLIFLAWVLTFVLLLKEPSRRYYVLLCLAIIVYTSCMICITTTPIARYQFRSLLVEVMLAGSGLVVLFQNLTAMKWRRDLAR